MGGKLKSAAMLAIVAGFMWLMFAAGYVSGAAGNHAWCARELHTLEGR